MVFYSYSRVLQAPVMKLTVPEQNDCSCHTELAQGGDGWMQTDWKAK